MFYARSGGPAAVPPYASNREVVLKQWEIEQLRHQKRMADIPLEPRQIDQKEPATSVDVSLQRGRERSRAYLVHEHHQQVNKENQKLMGALHEISNKPCITLKRIASDPGMLPPITMGPNKEADRRRRQKALVSENERIVKRLLAIKTTFNTKKTEKEYSRHQKAVLDMAKVPPPGWALQQRERRKVARLPPLAAVGDDELGTFIPAESSQKAQTGRLSASRSMPTLVANRQPQKRALSASGQQAAPPEANSAAEASPTNHQRSKGLAKSTRWENAKPCKPPAPSRKRDVLAGPAATASQGHCSGSGTSGAGLPVKQQMRADVLAAASPLATAAAANDRNDDTVASMAASSFYRTGQSWNGDTLQVFSPESEMRSTAGIQRSITADVGDELAAELLQAITALQDEPDSPAQQGSWI